MRYFVLKGQLFEFDRPEVLGEKLVREATEAEIEFYDQIVKSQKKRDKIWGLSRKIQDVITGKFPFSDQE